MKKQVRSAPKAKLSGFRAKNHESRDPALVRQTEYQEGRSRFARGGSVGGGYPLSPSTGGAGGGLGRLRKAKAAARVPDRTES